MKSSSAAVLILILSNAHTSVIGFQQLTTTTRRNDHDCLWMANKEEIKSLHIQRRSFIGSGISTCFVGLLGLQQGLLLGTQSADAGLLDEFGNDPSKFDATPTKIVKESVQIASKKSESDLEPNLRSNYYYPTNKKRYLPRIKKCNDAIPDAATMIGSGDWIAAADFADKIAEDTILPMKLYTSSLLGGGTNVKVSFAKDMNKAANDFEKAQKKLSKAIAKQDKEKSTQALEDLSQALLSYRTAGKLLGPDGGGDIPSVDDIRRSASRTQKLMFEEQLRARDERVKASSS